MEMEESSALYIDPDEDEIFFYGVGQKETDTKKLSVKEPKLVDVKSMISDNYNEQDGAISINPDISTEKPNGNNDCIEEHVENYSDSEEKDKEIPVFQSNHITSEKKWRDQSNETANKMNIHIDHNYSTPVKNIIDRSILRTPKSVVKADKDGGFLKVLSEIALVKAEADENLLKDNQKSVDPLSPKEELLNDDNKENNQSDPVNEVPVITIIEATPIKQKADTPKMYQNSTLKKYHYDSNKKKNQFNSNENQPDNLEELSSSCLENEKNKINQPTLTFKEPSIEFTSVKESVPLLNQTHEPSELEVVFEKFKDKKSLNEKVLHNEMIPASLNDTDLIKFDQSVIATSEAKIQLQDYSEDGGNLGMETEPIKALSENLESLTLNDNERSRELTFNKNEKENDNESENTFAIQKKSLRRKTMKFLEDLSEIVHPENQCSKNIKSRLSIEARKVIDRLRTGLDDSIYSSDQCFDLDLLNDSFFGGDTNNIFFETISKSVHSLTNNELELLLEGITLIDNNLQTIGRFAENKNNEKKVESATSSVKKNDEKKSCNVRSLQKDGKSKSCVKLTPMQYKFNKPPAKSASQSETKKAVGKSNDRALGAQSKTRICRTVEKNSKPMEGTRIPKLLTSKATDDATVKLNTKPATALKAQRSLKYENIKSPIQAYINAKTPVLMSKVKAKCDPGPQVWLKHAEDTPTNPAPEEPKQQKSKINMNLPFVQYKSAIPLKLERPQESRLPRLAPKMKKLVGDDSPVVTKHEGRIKVAVPAKPGSSENETLVASENEVSVLISRVALTSSSNK